MFPLYDHNPHRRIPWLTGLIILANVGVMLWLSQVPPKQAEQVWVHYGFIPRRLSQIDSRKPVNVVLEERRPALNPNAMVVKRKIELPHNPRQVYMSLLTTMFLHGGWLHLATNMWMLWVFGNNIEDRLGHLIYLGFYLLGGLIATMTHFAVDPHSTMPLIGASGAVAAVLGGYAVTFPAAKVRTLIFVGIIFFVDLPALVVLGVWFLFEMAQGVGWLQGMVDVPIAFWAHIGGFVAGMILIPIFSLGATPPEVDWQKESEDMFKFDDIVR